MESHSKIGATHHGSPVISWRFTSPSLVHPARLYQLCVKSKDAKSARVQCAAIASGVLNRVSSGISGLSVMISVRVASGTVRMTVSETPVGIASAEGVTGDGMGVGVETGADASMADVSTGWEVGGVGV